MGDMAAMFESLGLKPEDVLSDEEIDKHLTEAFNKFDEDGSGQLGQWEFMQAWFFLGLKGSEDEINDSFKSVDTNNSGLVISMSSSLLSREAEWQSFRLQ